MLLFEQLCPHLLVHSLEAEHLGLQSAALPVSGAELLVHLRHLVAVLGQALLQRSDLVT